jgi:hypothetical protein
VKIARLILRSGESELILDSFTVHQCHLRNRYIDILIDWASHPELHDAFRDEIIDILLQWSSAPP